MSDRGIAAAVRVGVGAFDAEDPLGELDLAAARAWSLVALLDGVPITQVDTASPGAALTPRLAEAVLGRRTMHWQVRARLIEDLCARLDLGREPEAPEPPVPPISVVLCTYGRPQQLPRALAALGELDPAPEEVIVVDNDPAGADCHELVRAAGFSYLAEPRKGLDNARNAGILAARGELIAFTDDDCAPSPGWLAALPRLFEDPTVAGATGPMFPYRLDNRAQQLMERVAGMQRGFVERRFDWQIVSTAHASAIGVGANMAFRRAALVELGPEPFPPELDAGTATQSGGDTYLIARLIAAGHRIVYAPAMYGRHDHRGDEPGLVRAVRGYGVGISAAMTKLIAEDRELEAVRGWLWLLKQHLRMQVRGLLGTARAEEVDISREYIRGGLLGPSRWRTARRDAATGLGDAPVAAVTDLPEEAPRVPSEAARAGPDPGGAGSGEPRISVVVPSGRLSGALTSCLRSLVDQTLDRSQYEVVVVDDRPLQAEAGDAELPSLPVPLRVLRTGGQGASAARNLGASEARAPIVLFLDDDMVADPDLLSRHLERQAELPGAAVVGSYYPYPVLPGLAAQAVALWWSDHLEAMRRSQAPTLVWLLTGNLSAPRQAFLDSGGFSKEIPYRREDWEFGLRWLGEGRPLAYDPAASARHEYTLQTPARLRGVELEGFGDAMISRMHPGSSGPLPLIHHRPIPSWPSPRRFAYALATAPGAQAMSLRTLDLLEAARLRGAWLALIQRLQRVAYKQGLQRAGFRPEEARETCIELELLGSEACSPPQPLPPTLRVTLAGLEVERVRPQEGFWSRDVARQIADRLDGPSMERVGVERGWLEAHDRDNGVDNQLDAEVVELADDPSGAQWSRVVQAAEHTDRELTAIVWKRAVIDDRWLSEAAIGFDGDRVGGMFGRALADERPVQPIYLYDETLPVRFRPSELPLYLVLRSSELREMGDLVRRAADLGETAPGIVLMYGLVQRGWAIGLRHVHGLGAAGGSAPRQLGRAWAAAEMTRRDSGRRTRVRTAASLLARIAWERRQPGGPADRDLLELALGAVGAAIRR